MIPSLRPPIHHFTCWISAVNISPSSLSKHTHSRADFQCRLPCVWRSRPSRALPHEASPLTLQKQHVTAWRLLPLSQLCVCVDWLAWPVAIIQWQDSRFSPSVCVCGGSTQAKGGNEAQWERKPPSHLLLTQTDRAVGGRRERSLEKGKEWWKETKIWKTQAECIRSSIIFLNLLFWSS